MNYEITENDPYKLHLNLIVNKGFIIKASLRVLQ